MGPLTAISTALAKIFTYSGRASRSEYWWYYLACVILGGICSAIDALKIIEQVTLHGEAALFELSIYSMATFWCFVFTMPAFISVTVRRLHDAGFSGMWAVLLIVPFGPLVLMILHMMQSQGGTSVHGSPAVGPSVDPAGKPVTADAHQRAMQGYALLFDKDKTPSPEMQAARKAEIADYYRNTVLKSAPSA